ncbi:DUF4404 family protein [Aeoliella sp. SH292]|jgi:hypothetical protein|uniref:DUF4404 family protein n=1 Tax=Aeoliella sp. SH292 TaxID=3454464 RepID=UPI003F9D38EF
MDADKLRGELTKLHQELSTVETVDAPTKEMLVTVMQDIAHLLTGDKPTGENAPSSDSLREMMTDFEAEHPQLAQALGRLADGLANLGI